MKQLPESLILALVFLSFMAHDVFAGKPAGTRPIVLIVVGAGGTDTYAEQFKTWAQRWQAAGQKAKAFTHTIGLDQHKDSDLKQFQFSMDWAKEGTAPLWIVLIGHGTFDGRSAKFNLRGPDLSANQLKTQLDGAQRPVALINCSASSAPFIPICSGTNRVVITATKSGFEDNLAKFGDHMSAAIDDPKADLNGDEQISLLEAFLTATDRLTRWHGDEGKLATEHPLIDDNGDGKGTRSEAYSGEAEDKAPNPSLDGRIASRWHLVPSRFERMLNTGQRTARNKLEDELEKLKQKKQDLEEAEYLRRLEALLIKIAHLYDAAEAAAPATSGRP